MSRFIDFSEGKALMVNNADWLLELNYIDVLRDIGTHVIWAISPLATNSSYTVIISSLLQPLVFAYYRQ